MFERLKAWLQRQDPQHETRKRLAEIDREILGCHARIRGAVTAYQQDLERRSQR